jgi:hypothetical protein
VYRPIDAMFPVSLYTWHMIIMLPDRYRFPFSVCLLILLAFPIHPIGHTSGGIAVEMIIFVRQNKGPVPVFTVWRVLRLRVEGRSPVWRVAANILNKQSRTTDEGLSSSMGVVRGASNSSPYNWPSDEKGILASGLD